MITIMAMAMPRTSYDRETVQAFATLWEWWRVHLSALAREADANSDPDEIPF